MIEKPLRKPRNVRLAIEYTVVALLAFAIFVFCFLENPLGIFTSLSVLYIFVAVNSCFAFRRDYCAGKMNKADFVRYCIACAGAAFLAMVCTAFMIAPLMINVRFST